MDELYDDGDREEAEHLVTHSEAIRCLEKLICYVGEDPAREGLIDTPSRVLAAWKELLAGYDCDPKAVLKTQFAAESMDEMIVVKGIEFTSFCEHHWLPFTGHVDFGYIPDKKIVGLSKIPRLVNVYAKRLQVQERMTGQIAYAFAEAVECRGVGVVVTATHSCMSCRGVRKQQASMITSTLLGAFKSDASTRSEFLSFIRRS